jgi:hypothetical protein
MIKTYINNCKEIQKLKLFDENSNLMVLMTMPILNYNQLNKAYIKEVLE